MSGLELREGNQKWTRRVPPIPPGGAVSIEVTGAFSPEEGAVRIVDTRHRLEYTVVEYYESELVGRVDVVLTGVTDDGTLVIRALDGAGFMHEEAEWVTSTPEPSEESSAIAEPSVIGSAGPVHP